MPFLAAIPAIIGAIHGSGQASAGAQTNIDVAQQEMQRRLQIFQQLQPFFSQYLQQGSPFLQNIQRAGAEQNAQQFGNAAGQLRGEMQRSGLGYGPSGTTAAALGQLGQGAAQSSANTYLQNLLANEQIKFQAAQGLNSVGNMIGSQQNVVGQPPQPTQNNIGSAIYGFGQSVNSALAPMFGGGTNPGITTGPTPAQAGLPWNPAWSGAPTTQGTYGGNY